MQQTNPRSIIIYKPCEGAPIEYVGPFVSERLAYEYVDKKMPNGKAIVRPLKSRDH